MRGVRDQCTRWGVAFRVCTCARLLDKVVVDPPLELVVGELQVVAGGAVEQDLARLGKAGTQQASQATGLG